jgi:hypothetical protein
MSAFLRSTICPQFARSQAKRFLSILRQLETPQHRHEIVTTEIPHYVKTMSLFQRALEKMNTNNFANAKLSPKGRSRSSLFCSASYAKKG